MSLTRNLTSDVEVANTRKKLADLETRYEELRISDEYDTRLQEMTMRSLKKLINQLKEEIIRYEVASRS
jgi:hypothetical protein